MNKKTFMMALCMVGHSGYAVDQLYIDGSDDQRQRLLDNALDHRNYAPIRVPDGSSFKANDPVDPLKDVTKMSPQLQIDLHDALKEKTEKMKADIEKREGELESELEHAKQEVLSQLKNPEISGNSPMDTIITTAWKDVADYKSKLKELEASKKSLDDSKKSLDDLKSTGWTYDWVVERENRVVEQERELDNLKKDVIRVVLKGEIAENASVEEVLEMARNRVNNYDHMVYRLEHHLRDKKHEGYSSSGWDQNRMREAQLRKMQEGLEKLEKLQPAAQQEKLVPVRERLAKKKEEERLAPARARLVKALAVYPGTVDLMKALRDGKNQGLGVSDIEQIVDEHYKGGKADVVVSWVRSWPELLKRISSHDLEETVRASDTKKVDLLKAIIDAKEHDVDYVAGFVNTFYKGSISKPEVSAWVNMSLPELREKLMETAMEGDPKKVDLLKAISDGKNQGVGVLDIKRIVDTHYKEGNKGSFSAAEVRSWAEWSTEKLDDEMKKAQANADKKQKQKRSKARKQVRAMHDQERDAIRMAD